MRKHEKSHFNSGEYPCFFKCLHMYSVALATEKIVIVPTRVGWIVVMQSTGNSTIGLSPRAWGRCVTAYGINDNLDGSSPRAWGRCPRVVDQRFFHHGSSPRAWGRSHHMGFYLVR